MWAREGHALEAGCRFVDEPRRTISWGYRAHLCSGGDIIFTDADPSRCSVNIYEIEFHLLSNLLQRNIHQIPISKASEFLLQTEYQFVSCCLSKLRKVVAQ